MTARIAIVFFSGTGTAAALAEAVADGVGPGADLQRLQGADIVEGRYKATAALEAVDGAAAVLFGSPTYMGGPAAEFKTFADASSDRWSEQRWAGKIAAGFTCGGFANGDQSWTLGYFQVLANQHGMLWCGLDLVGELPDGPNRLGCQAGATAAVADGPPDAGDLATARHLGTRVARLVQLRA
ncbi:MAG: flavodoxin family protein [Pseudomonadota bacterium]